MKDLELFIEELERTYPDAGGEPESDGAFQFGMRRKFLEDMLFPLPPDTAEAKDPAPREPLGKTKKARMNQRKQSLLKFLRQPDLRSEVTTLRPMTQIDRYQLIVRLRAIQALNPDPDYWPYRRLERLIQRIDSADLAD